jgi:hypothetical protein
LQSDSALVGAGYLQNAHSAFVSFENECILRYFRRCLGALQQSKHTINGYVRERIRFALVCEFARRRFKIQAFEDGLRSLIGFSGSADKVQADLFIPLQLLAARVDVGYRRVDSLGVEIQEALGVFGFNFQMDG